MGMEKSKPSDRGGAEESPAVGSEGSRIRSFAHQVFYLYKWAVEAPRGLFLLLAITFFTILVALEVSGGYVDRLPS